MKCVKNVSTTEIHRIEDAQAEQMVGSGKYVHISKSEWKRLKSSKGKKFISRIKEKLLGKN